MKQKLLTSTAVGALLAASSYAYAGDMTLKFFGGLSFVGDDKFDGRLTTSNFTSGTGATIGYGGISGIADFDTDMGWVFGGAVGYQWDNGVILELEAAYRRNKLDISGVGNAFGHSTNSTGATSDFTGASPASFNSEIDIDGDSGHVSAVSLLANVWYEFNLANEQWKPYLGGGIGIAWLDMHGLADTRRTSSWTTTTFTSTSTGNLGFHGDESGFAWQLGAGIGYEFAPGKQITLDYRWFNVTEIEDNTFDALGNDLDGHNLLIGVRLDL
jgi:opacity protein-like surface antigen